MRPRVFGAARVLLSLSVAGVVTPLCLNAHAEDIPAADATLDPETSTVKVSRELQLEVFINGISTDFVAAFRQDADGALVIEPDQLRNVGIEPVDNAIRDDGLVEIARLPDVSFEYDEASQIIYFSAEYDALSARVIKAHESDTERTLEPQAQSSVGVLVNYSVFGSTGGDGVDDMWEFEGVSGWFEGRAFSPLGVFTSSQIVSSSPNELYGSTRLETTWSYSSQSTMTSYRVGDVIAGGLSWTRPIRLGGMQIQRNFGLRPDLVTMPLPELSGSAAVPSTVDVYVNNARRISQQVPAGPFQITDLPVITGSGTARVVVRDALGRETVSEAPFFASSDLLAPGLWDYSAEAGFARRFYGTESNDYDGRFMASGTLRYGLNDRLTLEGHAEGGGGLINGGAGAVFGIGRYGIGSLAGAASSFEGQTGFQVAASIELELWNLHFFARTQRTFDDYHDIASATFDPKPPLTPDFDFVSAAPPRALDQVSVSVPLTFDPTTLNFSYTQFETVKDERSRIIGFSLNRPFGKAGSIFATAFTDLDHKDSFGVFAGLSIPFGSDIYASTGVSSDSEGTAVTTDLVKSENAEIGSVGWRIRDTEGAYVNRAASASYRAPIARFEAGVQQYEDLFRATAQVDGAVVLAGGDIFLSNRIDDAFAVVDAGVPGVEVQYENRPAGRTNRQGKLLVPDLRSYEPNQITIDPNLPVDANVAGTREVSVPADRSGTVVKFAVETGVQAALVTLRDEAGDYLETGAAGEIEGSPEHFTVGYDGQAYITGLGPRNRAIIDQPTRGRCVAEFAFQAQKGEQVAIPDAVCRPVQ
ncbi:fimbria/pilus outer membrane usher protein [Sinorhizobium meliloti]|uniref:fimbria/pilus outer membrane usher protein n=1 Tax=Rhizobium meliloti TaxID=382 RepID=UPI000FD426C1|nr:fimbria/pilus outer membrane usher protein [Sinorhizobium meliloti]RVN87727.1 fimbrial biogenesis outer membrane usher protein [Sinorhizobium meliloti]RVO60275.1 fimbrial biogenesis outer membrane usher protein [Sinorhizobium meliloti]